MSNPHKLPEGTADVLGAHNIIRANVCDCCGSVTFAIIDNSTGKALAAAHYEDQGLVLEWAGALVQGIGGHLTEEDEDDIPPAQGHA
jgi:hypothetical protein